MQQGFTGFAISPMRIDDLDEVLAIENYSFPTPWQRHMYEHDLLKNPHSRFYVIRDKESGKVAAYSGTWFIYDEAHVGTIATGEEFRGKRLAEQLLAYTALHAVAEKIRYIILEVRTRNEAAIRLYERLGFEQVGLRKGYYTDTREDALLMTNIKLAELAQRLAIDEDPIYAS